MREYLVQVRDPETKALLEIVVEAGGNIQAKDIAAEKLSLVPPYTKEEFRYCAHAEVVVKKTRRLLPVT